MQNLDKLRGSLARHGYKVTSVRERIYSALAETEQPLSTAQLVRRLNDMDKVSVYRTVALFERIGIVHRIWNGFKSSIELSEEYSPHHHHFTCTACGTVLSFRSERIERALHGLEHELLVTISRHVVELGGRCGRCANEE